MRDRAVPRRHVAFFSFAGYGHVKPMVPLVEEMIRRGHRVTYVVADRYADVVEKTGAELLVYHSTFPPRTPPVRTAEDATRMIIDLLDEGFAALDPAAVRFADDRPDMLIHDTVNPYTARVLAREWDLPLGRTYPVFAFDENHQFPGGPATDPNHPAATGYDASSPELAARQQSLEERVAAVAAKHDIAAESLADAFVEGDEDLHLLFFPRVFQYGGDGFGERFSFIGPCVQEYVGPSPWTPPTDGRPVLLVTASTAAQGLPGYFRTCAEAFADRPWHVVLTLGEDASPDEIGPLPPNVTAHSWLPHRAMLPHVTAMVCGAGMNGLMEASYYGCPVVAVPLSEEQEANAKRVADLRLGTMLLPSELTPAAVHQAVTDIVDDANIRAGLAEMREHIRVAGGVTKGVDDIEAVIAGRSV